MSPNRAAKSLEILNVIAVQAVSYVVVGPCSHCEVVAFEVETSMLRSVEDILLPILERSHLFFRWIVGRRS